MAGRYGRMLINAKNKYQSPKLIKAGKKTKVWNKVRKELKDEFMDKGITRCELGFSGCWMDNALSFAHLDKRRFLNTATLGDVVLACIPCHMVVEKWPREKMKAYLEEIIEKRDIWKY